MRTILLDTHVALWVLVDSPHLPAAVRAAAGQSGIRWVFHQVSTWEIQIKHDLGKLPLPASPGTFLPNAIEQSGLAYERIEDDAIFMLPKLPDHHRDPFDRLLIAHAAVHGWEVATVDEQVMRYPVRIFV
jgi:PIN domain nuclease of toxin-antitoxin system